MQYWEQQNNSLFIPHSHTINHIPEDASTNSKANNSPYQQQDIIVRWKCTGHSKHTDQYVHCKHCLCKMVQVLHMYVHCINPCTLIWYNCNMEKGLTMSTKLSLYFKIAHKVFIVTGFVIVYHLCAHIRHIKWQL